MDDMFYGYNIQEDNGGFYVMMYDNNNREEHEVCFCKNEKIAEHIMNHFDNLAIADERDLFDDPTPVGEY